MEDIPPSYFQSMNPSVLDLIAPYLDTLSLHALTLVSRAYNETFMPHLWGSPASHFVPMAGPTLPGDPDNPQANGSHDDIVYVALTRFKRTLKKARLSTRCLVHTLFLPPALSEIYGGPNSTWLKEVLDGLPNLQSLCVGGLPFFDHHSLVAVDRQKGSTSTDEFQTYPLKLLLASKEPNTTSTGLALFLPHVRNLVYLDLSYTTAARDPNVLSALSLFYDLQILKLRGIGIRDQEAEILANAIGLRVRLLDVAENFLSDMGIRSLLQACFQHTSDAIPVPTARNHATTRIVQSSRQRFESWPVSLPPAPDFLSLDTLRSSDFDKNLRVQLTNPLTGRLAFEDIPHAGLTHLYITGNSAVTIEGVKSLLVTGRLHVFDAGEVAGETVVDKYVRSAIGTGRLKDRPSSFHSSTASTDSTTHGFRRKDSYEIDTQLPGAEKLIPVLREHASRNLTYLRIDHALITKAIDVSRERSTPRTSQDGRVSPVELSAQIGVTQLVEAPGTNRQPVEMPTEQIYELDATSVVRAELPGDPIHFALTPPVGEKPGGQEEEVVDIKPVRGVGPYAPEVVVPADESESELVLDATGSGRKRPLSTQTLFSPVSPLTPQRHTFGTYSTESSDPVSIDAVVESSTEPDDTQKLPQQIVTDRQNKIDTLLRSRLSLEGSTLNPASVPNLRTLKLTNIPTQVPESSQILVNLKQFIKSCALEAHLALCRARTDYSLPPGRARFEAERKHAQSLFALETIVLEMVPTVVSQPSKRDWKHTRQRLNISKSSTGDHDSEALWSAAENDFSFFGEEGEEQDECGIYDHEPGKYFPQITFDEKFVATADDVLSSGAASPFSPHLDRDSRRSGMQSQIGTVFKSPLELPLGRNRRSSNEGQRNRTAAGEIRNNKRLSAAEMPGTIPRSNPTLSPPRSVNGPSASPTSKPAQENSEQEADNSAIVVDVVSELSKFRKERKKAYEEEVYKQNFVRINGVSVPISRTHQHFVPTTGPDKPLAATTSAADMEVFVEGHWKGEIKVIRVAGGSHHGDGNANGGARGGHKRGGSGGGGSGSGSGLGTVLGGSSTDRGRFQRNGMVDIYGNYFEKGYLYS